MRLLGWALLLGHVLIGCSTTRVVRLSDGDDLIVVTPHEEEDAPLSDARIDEEEFQQALAVLASDVRPFSRPLRQARELFGLPERSGLFGIRARQLVPLDAAEVRTLHLIDPSEALTQGYQDWCRDKDQPQDCLRLLEEGPLLGTDGRYALAMAIAMASVWDETAEALRGMASPQALLATVTSTVTLYLLLWALPEPVSKGLAALITAAAIAYLGVDTVWTLLDGWVALVRTVDRATTFEQVREAGEAYGEVLGKNAARVFVMLATAALGNTAGLVARASSLPGSAQAALAVESQAGCSFVALGSVESVAMTAEGFTIALAPNAVAMSSRDTGPRRIQKHHIATIRNEKSSLRGGPWTPRLRRLFKKAGMDLKDPENIVPVEGHAGPHPREYHELIFKELDAAMAHCRTVEACRTSLQAVLRRLAKEISTQGSELNLLVTHGATP